MTAQPPAPTALHLRRPRAAATLAALALVLVVAGGAEALTRGGWPGKFLPPPSIGSGQAQLDRKLVFLAEARRSGRPVDVVFFGNSQVYRGIDPVPFGEAFARQTGRRVHSFNFGLGGASEVSNVRLARILVGQSRPRLIVAGASSFSLAEDRGTKFAAQIEFNPWFLYREGRFNLDGWMIDHSAAFRQYLGCLFWWEKRPETKLKGIRESIAGMRPDGFAPLPAGAPKKMHPNEQALLADFEMSPSHLEALCALLRLGGTNHAALVEMPVPAATVKLYARQEEDHLLAREAMARVAARFSAPFLGLTEAPPIQDDHWYDYAHLNGEGAQDFSAWLGEQVGKAVREGRLSL